MRRRTRSGQALSDVVAELLAVSGPVASLGGDFGRDSGLSIAGFQTISALGDELLTVPQIAQRLSRRRQTIQQAVDQLLNRDLVTQVPNPANRRSPLIETTPEGKTAFWQALQHQIDWANETSKRFNLDDLAAAARVLRQLNSEIDR